jgi:conjugative relaxase-like TrwC/TraI family protein
MLIMLRITAVSAGAVDYLLRGSGCAEHEHAKERDPGAELEVDGAGGAEGADRSGPDAAGYFLSATEHGEAPGRWFGTGLEEMLGIKPGTAATKDDVRSVFGELKHPETGQYLGRPPRTYREYEARLAAALAKEPDATPERRREIELATRLDSRKAVAYYDLTFSPAKSVSVYYAALLAAGADGDAAKVMQAHNYAVNIALGYAEQHAAYTRVGYHGKTREGRSVGRYEAARGLPALTFSHSTNREGEPQIHTHAAVLNRVVTASDGQIRALDGKGFRPIKEALAVAYERALEQRLGEELGVRFAWRPDGKAREILGVDPDLCREASTRRAQVEQRVGELVEAYVDRHGYAPDAAASKAIAQMATLDTRRAKEGKAGPAAVREWGETRAERLTNMLDAVDAAAARVAREGNPDRAIVPDQHDRTAIMRAAVEEVQSQYPTWTLGNLVAAIDRQPRTARPTSRPWPGKRWRRATNTACCC